jgi:hypothetical protein
MYSLFSGKLFPIHVSVISYFRYICTKLKLLYFNCIWSKKSWDFFGFVPHISLFPQWTFFTVLLAHINSTQCFHCDVSIDAYSVLWISLPPLCLIFYIHKVFQLSHLAAFILKFSDTFRPSECALRHMTITSASALQDTWEILQQTWATFKCAVPQQVFSSELIWPQVIRQCLKTSRQGAGSMDYEMKLLKVIQLIEVLLMETKTQAF